MIFNFVKFLVVKERDSDRGERKAERKLEIRQEEKKIKRKERW